MLKLEKRYKVTTSKTIFQYSVQVVTKKHIKGENSKEKKLLKEKKTQTELMFVGEEMCFTKEQLFVFVEFRK